MEQENPPTVPTRNEQATPTQTQENNKNVGILDVIILQKN